MESFWEEVKYQVKKSLPDHSYRMWIDPVELLEYDDQSVKLSSPNDYFIKRLKDNYVPIFKKEFSKLLKKFKIRTIQLNTIKNSSMPFGTYL